MQNKLKEQGFTLIELLLVVVIIGILLAVIVPRAWRANVDSKYGLVRQNATELASFASQWVEQMMEAQDLDSDSRTVTYYNSLARSGLEDAGTGSNTAQGGWIADTGSSNWRNGDTNGVDINGRLMGTDDALQPEAKVEDLVPPERLPRNPFSGSSVFRDYPDNNPIPGALAAGRAEDESQDGQWNYYALIFQGTDSKSVDIGTGTFDDTFHAGMNTDLPGLRNGIFMARVQYE